VISAVFFSGVVQMGVVHQAFGSGEEFSKGGTIAAQSFVSATGAKVFHPVLQVLHIVAWSLSLGFS